MAHRDHTNLSLRQDFLQSLLPAIAVVCFDLLLEVSPPPTMMSQQKESSMMVCKAAQGANGKTGLRLFVCCKVNSSQHTEKELTLLHKKQTKPVTVTITTTYDITMTDDR